MCSYYISCMSPSIGGCLMSRFHYSGLHDHGFYEPVEFSARVRSTRGDARVAAGAACHVRVSPVSSPRYNCRVQVDCGGEMLYGAGQGGFTRCAVEDSVPIAALDPWPSSEEGDPMLERAGRRIEAPRGGGRIADLRAVLTAARALQPKHGRRPTVDELATETGLAPDAVRTALMLARVMGR